MCQLHESHAECVGVCSHDNLGPSEIFVSKGVNVCKMKESKMQKNVTGTFQVEIKF